VNPRMPDPSSANPPAAAVGEEAESRLTQVFALAGRPLLIPYLTGGYPSLEGSRALIDRYLDSGADIVEIGVPFSDPLADGPTIQATSQVALKAGVTPADVFQLAAYATGRGAPVVLLAYLNTILARTPEVFFERCRDSGVLGVVVPDVPVDEAQELQRVARTNGVDVVLLAAPTSTDPRLDRIAASASGFIYCVSVAGVTGARSAVSADLAGFLRRLRARTELPLAVGFGISTSEQAGEVAKSADGAIIGSRLMSLMQEAAGEEAGLEAVGEFLLAAADAVRKARSREDLPGSPTAR